MSTRVERNELCQQVLDWQTERELEGWNEDTIKYEIGVELIDGNKIVLVDDSNLDEKTNIVVEFKEGKSGSYQLKLDEETNLYSISKNSSGKNKEKVEEEPEETDDEPEEEVQEDSEE